MQQSEVSCARISNASNHITQHQAQPRHSALRHGSAPSPAFSYAATGVSAENQSALHHENEASAIAMTIPFGHSTTTGSLLHMPQTSALLDQYPADLFFRIEQRRSVPPELALTFVSATYDTVPAFERCTTDPLVERFFSSVNSQHPVLDPPTFWSMYEEFPDQPPVNHALCLIVLALAEAASQPPEANLPFWQPGVKYFTPALRILLQNSLCSFGNDLALPQGLYLAALYYSYAMRPLLAWKLVHMASTNVQHLWIQYQHDSDKSSKESKYQFAIRLMWAIFVLECDIIAEYHLPRSGIEHVMDHLPFPQCNSSTEPHMLFWLADLSSRKLLNRVHHTMYNAPERKSGSIDDSVRPVLKPVYQDVGSYVKISEELRRQLETWYDYLPSQIQPNLDDQNPTADEAILLLRYHASGDIISRPFVFHVCSLPEGSQPPDHVLENCKMCIGHCRKFLDVFDNRVASPSGSTEIVLHSALSCVIVLTMASISPVLKHLVYDLEETQQKVVTELERWAFPGSSIKSMLAIVKALISKCRMMQDIYG
ncbi:hypothetical protein M3J09_005446 [Ascochyta lentis]